MQNHILQNIYSSDILLVVDMINNMIPFIYLKLGDGEFIAANKYSESIDIITSNEIKKGLDGAELRSQIQNCDGVVYTKNLQERLISASKYLLNLPNCYVGRWHGELYKFWENLAQKKVIWTCYQLFIVYDKTVFENDLKLNLYKSIKFSKLQKIYICNEKCVKESKIILNIDNHVIIHESEWFETEYKNVFDKCCSQVVDKNKIMFLVSGGIGAKVLIKDLHEMYPQSIIIDLGSALHFLFTRQEIRGFKYTYEELKNYFKDIM